LPPPPADDPISLDPVLPPLPDDPISLDPVLPPPPADHPLSLDPVLPPPPPDDPISLDPVVPALPSVPVLDPVLPPPPSGPADPGLPRTVLPTLARPPPGRTGVTDDSRPPRHGAPDRPRAPGSPPAREPAGPNGSACAA